MEDLSLASPSPSSLNPSNPTPAPASIGAEGRNSDVESVSTAEATAVTNNSETTHGSTEQPNTTATHDTETPSSSSIDSASTPLSTSNVILPVSAETLRNVTSKERFNFASGSCAASVIAANVEASGTSAILNENKDSYMLNKCLSREKFVVVELCDDVLVEVFALANFEILSSTVKDFTVYVSQQSNDGWKLLGRFRANNTREVQAFRVPAKVWGRYIRIEFVSHYGREVFCPLSLLRIHGRTMMDELKEEDSKRTDAPVENEALEEVEELLLGGTARPGSESHVRLPRRARDAELLRWNEPLDYGPLDMAETDVQLVRLFQRYFTAKSAASSESDSNGSSQQEASSSEDSVFRSMLKRLSLVERNVTASSKYLQDEVQIVHHYFNLLFAKVNNVSRTLQREIVSQMFADL